MRDLSVSRTAAHRRDAWRQAAPRILFLTAAHVFVLACSPSADGVLKGSVSSDSRKPEAGVVLESDASTPADTSSTANAGRSTGLAGDGAKDSRAGRADAHNDAGSTGTSLPCDVANVLARVQDDVHPMPPAPHARLSASDLATLTSWVEAGTPRSAEQCANVMADGEADPLQQKPDDCEQTFEFRAHGGTPRDDGSKFALDVHPVDDNQHQCFDFDALYGGDQGMLWYEPIVDNQPVLHHWVLYGVDQKTHENGTSAPCESPDLGSYALAAWAPGANNDVVPDDVALTLPSGPNAELILQLHYYNSSGRAQDDASGIRLCTGAKTRRAQVAAVHMLDNQNICLAPGTDSQVAGTCSARTDMGDIHITGVWPHMHKLGRRMQLTINRNAHGPAGTLRGAHSERDVCRVRDSLAGGCARRCAERRRRSSGVGPGQSLQRPARRSPDLQLKAAERPRDAVGCVSEHNRQRRDRVEQMLQSQACRRRLRWWPATGHHGWPRRTRQAASFTTSPNLHQITRDRARCSLGQWLFPQIRPCPARSVTIARLSSELEVRGRPADCYDRLAPMTQVKGSNLKYVRDFAFEKGGEEAWQTLLSEIGAQDRAAIESILASSWCDLSLQHRVFRALDTSLPSTTAGGAIVEFAEFVAHMDLTRVHRLFLRFRSPAYVLDKTAEYWSRFYDAGEWRITRCGSDAASGVLSGIVDCDPIFCRFIQAYIRAMFKIAGATTGVIRHTECVCLGARSCVYEGRWHE